VIVRAGFVFGFVGGVVQIYINGGDSNIWLTYISLGIIFGLSQFRPPIVHPVAQ
jgi:hypothetical protein